MFLIAVMVGFVLNSRNTGPVHDGRSLHNWLEQLTSPFSSETQKTNAILAIQAIGSNAVPSLVKRLSYEPGPRDRFAKIWNDTLIHKFPDSFRWKWRLLLEGNRPLDYQQQASTAFRILGSNAASAVPKLAVLVHNTRFSTDATSALEAIGTVDAALAIAGGLTNTNAAIRLNALGQLGFAETNTLALLFHRISDLQTDPNDEVAAMAVSFTGGLLPEHEAVPFLIGKLRDKRTLVQRAAISGLFYGPESAMAPISECFSSGDVTNRRVATNALLSINPYRAQVFGVNTNGLSSVVFERFERRRGRASTAP
jgi:hypothetical protein